MPVVERLKHAELYYELLSNIAKTLFLAKCESACSSR
ncbi:hypothetical protein NAEX_03501 [Nannocystis exedens]|nr:hypothetical protein NAEX_03501 [Nannocystis exedens]